MPAYPHSLSLRIQWVSAKRVFAPMIDGEWFALHRRKGYEDGSIRLNANPVLILGRKVLIFGKDAAWMRASDTARSDFSVTVDDSSAKLLWINIAVSFDLSRTGWELHFSEKRHMS
jgi:hypothetical protein